MDRKVIIRTFPTREGDAATETTLSALTEKQVFKPNMAVAMGDRLYESWDDLLEDIHKQEETEEVEILQFMKVLGG